VLVVDLRAWLWLRLSSLGWQDRRLVVVWTFCRVRRLVIHKYVRAAWQSPVQP
jgi:hypothetical protein